MINLKRIVRILLGKKISSDEFISYLRKIGVKVGDGCRFFDPESVVIDKQNPYMLVLGDNVRITHGVVILTHDYSTSVIAGAYGDFYGSVGHVHIGNNVFVGINSIILKNTNIGDNVIIGAGSVISGDIESNSVYAGVPAKKIMSLDEFRKKISSKQKSDMINIALHNHLSGNNFDEKIYSEYQFCYLKREDPLPESFLERIIRTGKRQKVLERYYMTEPIITQPIDKFYMDSIKSESGKH